MTVVGTTMIQWTRRALACALALTLALVPAGIAEAAKRKKPRVDVTVMTRNIYLGGNIFRPIGAPDLPTFQRLGGELWAEVQGTDFPTRSKLLAREVRRTKPDLIGLQEVALWRRGPDGVTDGAVTPSTQVVYDFLKTLRADLKRLGLRYTLGSVQNEADIEAPIDAGYDVRLTMRDAILVKKGRGVRVTKRLGDNYTSTIDVPTPAGTLTSRRGWTAVDLNYRGKKVRFLNTHLEAFGDAQRLAQAQELVGAGGPTKVRRQLIVTGDMNSDPEGRESPSAAFDALVAGGLVDTWRGRFGEGFSCCLNNSDARDTDASGFDHRIDLILAKPRLRALTGRVVGDELSERAANGLWPSDHAGVVTKLRLR
jgi:endonuclease/exonuclease/phosphatase family metal-dependent hydrolase